MQPYGAPRQLRLGRGPTTAAYHMVAPDPARHRLTVGREPAAVEITVGSTPG